MLFILVGKYREDFENHVEKSNDRIACLTGRICELENLLCEGHSDDEEGDTIDAPEIVVDGVTYVARHDHCRADQVCNRCALQPLCHRGSICEEMGFLDEGAINFVRLCSEEADD